MWISATAEFSSTSNSCEWFCFLNFILPWCGVGFVYLFNKTFPTSFNTLFLLNIWLFSMPHTFSTFTRGDRRSAKKIAYTLALIALFLGSIVVVSNISGLVFLYSLYFYWQQFHYGKQNFGISRWNENKAPTFIDKSFYLTIVGLSLIGLLSEGPQSFFGYMLFNPFTFSVSKIAIFSLMMAMTEAYILFRPGQLRHALSHTLIFTLAYLYCEHFVVGWLLLNIFHNLQYLKFMKAYETRFSFILAPLVLTLTLYILQFHVFKGLFVFSLPISLVLMLALNFTHYSLDGLIWKRNGSFLRRES